MKQKIVIRVPTLNDDKSRSKALKTVVGVTEHLESATVTGAEKNQLEVVGEGIDAVELTRALRKKLACADLVSVVEDKKPEKKDDKEKKNPAPKKDDAEKKNQASVPLPWVWYSDPYPGHHFPIQVVGEVEPIYDPRCTIM